MPRFELVRLLECGRLHFDFDDRQFVFVVLHLGFGLPDREEQPGFARRQAAPFLRVWLEK